MADFGSVEFICGGCGKREAGSFNPHGGGADAFKPYKWFIRGDKDGVQLACSRECIHKIAEESGKTGVVLPW